MINLYDPRLIDVFRRIQVIVADNEGWMMEIEDQDQDRALVLRCRELHDVADKVARLLSPYLLEVGRVRSVYTFKQRIKPPGSILLKVRRKRAEGEEAKDPARMAYDPDHVTDVWGCRYVTLYQSQIPPTLKELLQALESYNKQSVNKVKLIEFIIYTNRPQNDPLSITNEALEVAKSFAISSSYDVDNIIRPPESRKSAYSSVHLLFAIDVELVHPGMASTIETGKFEIQVRDIFEEGWGEIQHDLIYSGKDRSESDSEDVQALNPLWQPHLNALKTFVDGCSQHASIIKKSSDFVRLKNMPSLDTKSATSRSTDRDAIVHVLRSRGSAQYVDDIEKAYSLIFDAQAADRKEESEANYSAAAAKLQDLIERLGEYLDDGVVERSGKPIGYFLKMEYANCLHFSRDESLKDKAIVIYNQLIEKFPSDPTAKLRLAVAMKAKTEEDLLKARALVIEALDLIPQDALTGPDHWIAINCQVHIGYINWSLSKIAQNKGNTEAEKKFLEEALKESLKGYERWREIRSSNNADESYKLYAHKALSNALYYVAQLINMGHESELTKQENVKTIIENIHELKVPEYSNFYKTRDNIMQALFAIGQIAEARDLARQNMADLRRRAESRAGRTLTNVTIERYLDREEVPNFRAAASVLADLGGAA